MHTDRAAGSRPEASGRGCRRPLRAGQRGVAQSFLMDMSRHLPRASSRPMTCHFTCRDETRGPIGPLGAACRHRSSQPPLLRRRFSVWSCTPTG